MARVSPREPLSHVAMFWLLASMGVATALPCLLVPPIEALHELAVVEALELMTVDQLEERAEQQKRLAEALRRDPQTNIRLAQRELGYRVPGTVAVPRPIGEELLSEGGPDAGPAAEELVPAWVYRLYPHRWAAAYRAERTRHMILFGSLALILAAFMLYRPKPGPAIEADRG